MSSALLSSALLSSALQQRIEQAITAATNATARFAHSQHVAGGCINDSRLVTLQDGRTVFIKTHPRAAELPGLFAVEHHALALLAAANAIRVPRPIASGADFIVLEAFRESTPGSDWTALLGQQLARLHHATQNGQRFGFAHDNYLGTSVQPNAWLDSWPAFWRDRRLGWQLRLFAQTAAPDDRLLRLGYRLLERLDALLAEPDEPAVLLHATPPPTIPAGRLFSIRPAITAGARRKLA